MQPKHIWANLISQDIEKTKQFYQALGCKVGGNADMANVSIGEQNFIINFFKKERLEKDFLGKAADTRQQNEIMFSISAENREQVDQWHGRITEAGGRIITKPYNYDEGYTFIFADPDGHKYNVLYWPNM